MSIQVRHVTKRFGDFTALDDVSLDVPSGALLALLGPSGSGKTTLLRIISGLEVADSGNVLYHDEDVTDAAVRERNVGFVFQHYALFRHMTVFENIAFGLRVRKAPKAEVRERVHELLRLIQLEGLERSLPSQLSGGQRQRVALARALAPAPKVLLLDEPFGALDAKVRTELRQWLRRLHDEIHVTSLFVTHDQEEAFEVADRVVVMHHGQVQQIGTPQDLFERPENAFVMEFLGEVNVFRGFVSRGQAKLGALEVSYPQHPHDEARAATAFVRAHELDLLAAPDDRPALRARVIQVNNARPVIKLRVLAIDFAIEISVNLDRERPGPVPKIGDEMWVAPRRVRVFVQDYAI